MKVTLLNPPATDVRSPHLAIPSLAAHLRASGIPVTVRDLNLEGALSLLQADVVREAVEVCAKGLRSDEDGAERMDLLLQSADFIVDNVERSPSDLRDPATFFDPHRHHLARTCIVAAIDLVSASHPTVSYNISSARYSVDGIDPSRLDHLQSVTADPRHNLFIDLYRSVLADLDARDDHVVGVSILNGQQIIPGLMLARMLKEHGHFVVIGGTVYAKFAAQLATRPTFFELFCDVLIPYEGESAMLALVERVDGDRDLDAVPNALHLDRTATPVLGPTRVEAVDALPTPDFDGLPLDQYLSPVPVLPILLGKGCYYNRCKFCDIPFINSVADQPYRWRDPTLVARDIATLHRRHGARHFELTDETLPPRLLLRLADELGAYPDVRPRFVGYARLEPGYNPDVCRRLHEMGMRKLFFGLESGSQETLDHMRKGIRLGVATRTLEHVANAGIGFHVFSIIGFPEESESSARATLQFFLDHHSVVDRPANSFDVHPFGLDLRTDYGDTPEEYGIEVDRAQLEARDFPITIKHWQNTRGLSHDDVDRLLAEFEAVLGARFCRYQSNADALWPAFEEYAVLYGDHYEERPFDWRLTLPPVDSSLRFRLIWAEDVVVEQVGGGRCEISCLSGGVAVGDVALTVLARSRPPTTCDDLLRALAAEIEHEPEQRDELLEELRTVIDRLLGIRALWLVPEGAESALTSRSYDSASVT